MVKKKGCICWPTIKRTGRSLRTSCDATAAAAAAADVDAVVKATCKASQLLSHDDEEDASIGKTSELQPSIPPEHDKFLEMLFPSSGRHRSRTLSLSISHPRQQQRQQPIDKRTRFRCSENSTSAAAGFRNRTLSCASSGGRRYPAPLGNDLLLLDMVPATPETYMSRGLLAATLPLGLRRGAVPRTRTNEWPDYMRRLELKKLQRCQCSGCKDDICSSSYKYPAAVAAEEDEEEEEEEERLVQLGPFFDNESYYNTHGCCSRERWKAAAVDAYDQPMSRLERQIRAGLYDVPTARHRSVLCSRHYLHDEEDCHQKDQEGEDNVCSHEEAAYCQPIGPCRESYSRQHRKRLQQSVSKVVGKDGEVNVLETVLDSHEKYDRPIEWSAKERISEGGARKGKSAVVMCRKCFACEFLKSGEASAAAERGWYQQMNAMAFPATNLRRRCIDDESSYVLSDSVLGTSEGGTDVVDCITAGQRMAGGGLWLKGRDGVASRRDWAAAEGGYVTPLSSKRQTMKLNDVADDKQDTCKETEQQFPPLSMRQFLKETRRKDSSSQKKSIQQSEDDIESRRPRGDEDSHERSEVIGGQHVDRLSSAKPLKSDAGSEEKNNDGLKEYKGGEKSSSNLFNQRREAEDSSSSSSQLATDEPLEQQDERLEKEITGNPKNKDDEDAHVTPVNEGDNRETNDRTIGSALTEEKRRNDKRTTTTTTTTTGSPLGSQSTSTVSQLDLLLMSPPPQCFYMVNHSYVNVAENKAMASVERNDDDDDVVLVHREMCATAASATAAADEKLDSYDTRRQRQMRTPPSEFYCYKQKPKACKTHFKPAAAAAATAEEEEEEEIEEFQVGRRRRPHGSPYVTLLSKTSSEYDFCHPYLPPVDEFHRNTCLAT